MTYESITTEDLRKFKVEFINELRSIISNQAPTPKVLRSSDVKAFLGVSDGTLEKYRRNKTLPFTKIGTTYFYLEADIMALVTPKIGSKPVN